MSKYDEAWRGEGGNRPPLPWRPDLDVVESDLPGALLFAALDYTQEHSERTGYPRSENVQPVAAALASGSYWCAFGNRIRGRYVENARMREAAHPAAEALAHMPRGQPKKYGPHGFINTMALALHYLDESVGTAWDGIGEVDAPSNFTRLCDGWLTYLDTEIPSRKIYRDAITRLKAAGLID